MQRCELTKCRQSKNNKNGPPSKRQKFSHDDSRDKVIQSLVSKLIPKELRDMDKSEEKEEVKGKDLKSQVIAILEEVKTNTNLSAFVSSNTATSNPILKSNSKKAGSNP